MKKIVIVLCACVAFIGLYAQYNNRDAVDVGAAEGAGAVAMQEQVQAPQAGLVKEAEVPDRFGENEFDPEKRKKQVIGLVERGIAYFKKNTLDHTCSEFTHTKDFIKGELYLFVFDMDGNCLAHGNEAHLLWQNLYDMKDSFGTPIVRNIIKTAKEGGGWVTYQWRNATKVSYVQRVTKEGKEYVIGAGYHPQSKKDAVVNMVKGAVGLFEGLMEENHPKEWAFARMSYPTGKFVFGDLYLFVLDEKGILLVQGDAPGLVGVNDWDWQDSNDKYVNREIINRLKKTDKGIWVEYTYKNAQKKAYAEKVLDKDGKPYFIACGYYPEADRRAAVDLAQRGYQYMKGQGLSVAVDMFTDQREDDFRYGDLYLFVFDMKGKCLAHGGNGELVGENLFDLQDADGRYYIRDIVQKAQDGGGWVTAKVKNAFQSSYVEKIDLGVDSYVIGTNFFPISKHETMTLLVKSGVSYLTDHNREKAFAEFIKRDGNFVRGDLYLFTFDINGICYAYGDDFDVIWRNLMGLKDDDGRLFIKIMINTIPKHGPGPVRYKLNGAPKLSYVESLEKDGKTYLIGSGYYT